MSCRSGVFRLRFFSCCRVALRDSLLLAHAKRFPLLATVHLTLPGYKNCFIIVGTAGSWRASDMMNRRSITSTRSRFYPQVMGALGSRIDFR